MNRAGLNNRTAKSSISYDAFLFSIYFLMAPFEDLLSFSAGTVLKYLAIVIVCVFFLMSIRNPTNIKLSDPIIIVPVLLVALSWTSVYWSINQGVSFSRNIAYTLLPALFLVVYIKKFNDREIKLVEKTIILSGIFMFIHIIANYDEFLSGMYGRFTLGEGNDPNNLAAHLILPLFIIIGKLIKTDKKNKIFLVATVCMFLFPVFITGSRGALVAVFIAITYLFFLYSRGKNIYKILVFVPLFVIIFYITFQFLPEYTLGRIFSVDAYTRDFVQYGSRSDIWRNVFSYILPVSPILGLGSGTACYAMASIYGHIKGIHNTYINMLVEFGVLGLPIFLFFLYKLYKKILKGDKKHNIGAFIAMLVIIFFLDSYSKKFFWNTLMFYAISLRIDVRSTNNLNKANKILK